MKFKQLLTYAFIVLLTGFTACSDNGGGTEDGGDAPAIPDITAQTQPDISFFENNSSGKEVAAVSMREFYDTIGKDIHVPRMASAAAPMNAYNSASISVLSSAFLGGFFPAFTAFIQEASKEDPSYNNGVWEWNYSQTAEGVTGSFRLTAEEKSSSLEWNLYMTFDDGESAVDNANIITGTIQNDGSSGNWQFRFPNESNTVELLFSSEWTISSDTENNLIFNVYDGSSSPVTEIVFDTNEPEHLMTFDDLEDTGSGIDFEVYWNTDSSIGYYFTAGGDPPKVCWNGSLQDVACSDVGL